MKPLRTFRLEEYLGEWEFGARHYLTASDAQSMTVGDLLNMGSESDREGFAALPLTYVETWGSENLREAIAGTYERVDAAHVLAFSGAQEALFWAMQELVRPGRPRRRDRAVLPVDGDGHGRDRRRRERLVDAPWSTAGQLDLDELRGLLRPTTRLVAVNYPNNPTGHVPDGETFRELVALCDERGIRLFCDEVYRGIEVDQARTLPQAADLSETALSLNVASKSYGLPGLRVGWLACRDRALLERLEKRKHYTSICNPGPSEYLAAIGLRHRDRIWARNRAVIAANLPLFADFFGRWAELFDWEPPLGGCVCFPRYKGAGSVDDFCRRLLEREGVVVLPASVYYSEIAEAPTDHFRVGVGRLGAEESLEAFDRCLRER